MIGGGSALLENAKIAAALLGDAGEHVKKIFATDAACAAAGDENATGWQKIKGGSVKAMIGHERRIQAALAAGEFWGIENHGTELFLSLGQGIERLERIAGFKAEVREIVEGGIPLCLSDRFLAGVDPEHFARTGASRGEGEGTGVAKEIEDAAALQVPGGGAAVFALVEIEAGLLADMQINFVRDAVLADDEGTLGKLPPDVAIFQFHAFELGGGFVWTKDDGARVEQVLENADDGFQAFGNRERCGLDDQTIAVTIDDESAEPVRFAEDQAGGGMGALGF